MPNKVFIYNGHGHFPESAADLRTLFETGSIFDCVDVRYTDLTENFSGLDAATDNLTLVFPGGNAYQMHWSMRDQVSKLSGLLTSGWNYVGVCAGGYLASHQIERYTTAYELNGAAFHNGFSPPVFSGGLASLAVCQDFNALGPFYPDTAEYVERIYSGELAALTVSISSSETRKPYCVGLALHNHQRLPALYVDGCAFERRLDLVQKHTVFASYPKRYSFLNPAGHCKTFDSMPAILHKKAARDPWSIQGGVVVSGIHFETCVADSRVLNCFSQPPNENIFALSSSGQQQLQASRVDAERIYVDLLKDSLTPL